VPLVTLITRVHGLNPFLPIVMVCGPSCKSSTDGVFPTNAPLMSIPAWSGVETRLRWEPLTAPEDAPVGRPWREALGGSRLVFARERPGVVRAALVPVKALSVVRRVEALLIGIGIVNNRPMRRLPCQSTSLTPTMDFVSRHQPLNSFRPACSISSFASVCRSFAVRTAAHLRGSACSLPGSPPYEGILVDADPLNFGDVLTLVKLLRQTNCNPSLVVFARYLDLEQRLGLFEAGLGDCVGEPFFASEMAVRLELSIRLRQAGASPTATNGVDVLRSGDLELDLVRRTVTRSGKAIDLRQENFCCSNTWCGTSIVR
jgi:hypothetical protein